MSYCIKIESSEHSEKVQKYMFSLGYDSILDLHGVELVETFKLIKVENENV